MSQNWVVKESLIYSILYYIGVSIGLVSTLFVYPRDLELYGLYGFLTNTASLFTPFITLGFGAVLIRYFPYHSHQGKGGSAVFTLVIFGYLLGALLFSLIFFFLQDKLIFLWPNTDPQIMNFIFWVWPLTLLYVLYDLIQTCSVNHQRIAFPAMLVNFFKIILPILFLLVIYKELDRRVFIFCVITYYGLISVLLFRYIRNLNPDLFRFNFSLFSSLHLKSILNFAAFNIISGVAAVMALRIDALMVASMMGAKSAGVFVLALFMSNAVFIPAQSLVDLLNPSVSTAAKSNDLTSLKNLYSKSVIHMLIPTTALSLVLWFSFDDLAQIMPNSVEIVKIKIVLAFLLVARMVDAATGVNHHVINYSKFYRIETGLLLFLAVSNISFNYLLIPIYGIEGAAVGTLISVSAYNLIKSFMVWWLMGLNPFGIQFIKLLTFISLVGIILYLFPNTANSWVNMAINVLIICVLYLWMIFKTNIAEDLRNYFLKFLKKYKLFKI
ncbi:MAG: polysaccharide biosynthesis C-terminal domain-containing protein [Saprospiraceae bacterium]|nr:polysaccharide biosynthesis C-terminal domain-containing protein [Saprospiraceae bacterium]